MNTRRRRADDFTNSLTSFRQIFNEERSQTVSQSFSEDSLDTDFIKKRENHIHSCVKNGTPRVGSLILAGNLTSEPFVSTSHLCETIEGHCNTMHSENNPLERETLTASDETSYLSIKPDLNKCINLFNNKHLNKEYDTCEEYISACSSLSENTDSKDAHPSSCCANKNKTVEVQCDLIKDRPRAVSSTSLKYSSSPNPKIRKSKSCTILCDKSMRDTNYNIKASQLLSTPVKVRPESGNRMEAEMLISLLDALSLSKSSISSPAKNDDLHFSNNDQKYDSTSSERSTEEPNPYELRMLLHSLESQEKPLQEAATQEHLLRRLSSTFYNSPRTFTERLLTIIEESVIHNDTATSAVNLSRLTAELRKVCKFIEDETAPEWPLSPSICMEEGDIKHSPDPMRKRSSNLIRSRDGSCVLSLSPNKSLHSISPRRNVKNIKKVYRCTPKNITGTNVKSSTYGNATLDSTNTFEHLEAYCKKLYPDECKSPMTRKMLLQSPLRNMHNILNKYENQMASLDNSPAIIKQVQDNISSTPHVISNCEAVSKEQNEYELPIREKRNEAKSKNVSNKLRKGNENSKRYEMIQPDDLENTLIYEIAKKRQRCLDTAKVMMEIDANSESAEAQQEYPNVIITESNTLNNDTKFMETLMSCKKYQNYLEEHKPLLNLLERTKMCNTHSPREKKDAQLRRNKKVNVATLTIPKSPLARKRSVSPSATKYLTASNKLSVPKSKLFVTPGKSLSGKSISTTKNCKRKRSYFPDLVVSSNKPKLPNISSHAKSIYRHMGLNYDTVVSPVGMYIRGTDAHLMKNLRPKTDETLLTPNKHQAVPSPSPKPQMKFRLSPKRKEEFTRTPGNENVPDNFTHPKVYYKLPSHVRTIKERENWKVGNRVNDLLRSRHDKVVIRHEGRMKSVQTQCSEPVEYRYDSAEESVHIEQTARKTCCSHVPKDS